MSKRGKLRKKAERRPGVVAAIGASAATDAAYRQQLDRDADKHLAAEALRQANIYANDPARRTHREIFGEGRA